MAIVYNFIGFWILLTVCVNRGDIFGMLLTMLAFLVMHVFCEEHASKSQPSSLYSKQGDSCEST